MKSKKSSLTAALFAALIGTAFVVTACWQGAPAGGSGIPGGGGLGSGGGNTASSIEGRWKANGGQLVLQLKNGKVTYTSTVGVEVSDSGTYTITGNTITFTGFTNPGVKMFLNTRLKGISLHYWMAQRVLPCINSKKHRVFYVET